MKIVITYNQPGKNATEDELDILEEVKLVSDCLKDLGHEATELPLTLDLSEVFHVLSNRQPDLVFNLAESLENQGTFVYFVPALLDVLQIPYTGNTTVPMFFTTGKHLTKQILQEKGLPVPLNYAPADAAGLPSGKYILKPVWEEGSLGLDEDSVFEIPGIAADKIIQYPSGKYLIEPYIDGREFNVSMLAGEDGPQVLAVAEIKFINYPADKPKVLGFKAKWNTDSFEYINTIRTYDLGKDGDKLSQTLSEMSLKCWDVLGLKGYARVDYRLDNNGNPFILEVNANPCITPGSGFYAACEYAGVRFIEAVDRIIKDALKK
jgi:D-alanine-D-alanine ligase